MHIKYKVLKCNLKNLFLDVIVSGALTKEQGINVSGISNLGFVCFLSVRKMESWQLQSVLGNDSGRRFQKAPGHLPSISFLAEYERRSSKCDVQLLNFLITLSHGKINVDNYKIMIQRFNTKCFHVEYEAPRIVLQAIECVVLLMEIKQGGAKANTNHWEAVHQY